MTASSGMTASSTPSSSPAAATPRSPFAGGIWLAVTLLLLLGIGFERGLALQSPVGVDEHRLAVAELAEALPLSTGLWAGTPVEVPTGAVDMLKPNALVSRTYEQVVEGVAMSLLYVHVTDARNLIGHYPPVCYPSQGWTQQSSEVLVADPRNVADGLTGERTRYVFTRQTDASLDEEVLIVENWIIVPGVGIKADMEAVDQVARSRAAKFFGAAQFQIISTGRMPEDLRTQGTASLFELAEPLLDQTSQVADQPSPAG
jgi:hypothetical protein